jgi:hypothetical protein
LVQQLLTWAQDTHYNKNRRKTLSKTERERGGKKRRAKAPAATTGQKPTHYHLPNFFLYCVIFPPNIERERERDEGGGSLNLS